MIRYLPEHIFISSSCGENIVSGATSSKAAATTTASGEIINYTDEDIKYVHTWTLEQKEKLLVAFVKVFTLNMPLYVAYKHLLHQNQSRGGGTKSCPCLGTNSESIVMIQMYCQLPRSGNHAHHYQVIVKIIYFLTRLLTHCFI